jgi:DHA1 family inner membrane transport protein
LLFGVGLTVGSTLGGKLGDRRLVPSILSIIAANAAVLTMIHFASATRVPMLGGLFVWGVLAFALVPLLQTLIVRDAEAAPNLASTLNQAAFNLGNAVGAWIGSCMLAAGLQLTDLSWASVGLTMAALFLAAWSSLLRDRAAGRAQPQST